MIHLNCFQERLLLSLTDLVAMTGLLGVTPAVREAASALARGDSRGRCIILCSLFVDWKIA